MLLYKFKSTSNLMHLLDIVVHERLYCPLYSELNDPFEGQFRELVRSGIPTIASGLAMNIFGGGSVSHVKYRDLNDLPFAKTTRVCSLTSSFSDVRMWSLYADSHRGVAVEIDTEELEPLPVQVRYDVCLPIGGTVLLASTPPEQVLTCKSLHWEYEAEYRIVTDKQSVPIAGRIRRVLVGTRTEPALIDLLNKVMPKDIGITRMTLVHSSVEVAQGESLTRA